MNTEQLAQLLKDAPILTWSDYNLAQSVYESQDDFDVMTYSVALSLDDRSGETWQAIRSCGLQTGIAVKLGLYRTSGEAKARCDAVAKERRERALRRAAPTLARDLIAAQERIAELERRLRGKNDRDEDSFDGGIND